jgi:regulator of replication initiation timing
MNLEIFDKYAQVKNQISMLELQAKDLKVRCEKEMQDNGQKSLENAHGKYTLSIKKTYKFSEQTEKMSEDLKIAQHQEKEQGIAEVVEETQYITFKAK